MFTFCSAKSFHNNNDNKLIMCASKLPPSGEDVTTSSAQTSLSCGAKVEDPMVECCSSCGASIQDVQEKRQAKTIGSCMICNLPITSEEECLRCAHCGSPAHKAHLLEWLHVKGCCPVCRMDLHEEDLVMSHNSKPLRR